MPEYLVWVLGVFAVYRLAKMIALEEGPFSVFYRLQEKLGGFDLAENGFPKTLWGRLITCPHCVGIYVSVFVLFLIYTNTWFGFLFVAWFGIAGAQSFLQELSG